MDGRKWKVEWADNKDFEFFGWKWTEGRLSPSASRSPSPDGNLSPSPRKSKDKIAGQKRSGDSSPERYRDDDNDDAE